MRGDEQFVIARSCEGEVGVQVEILFQRAFAFNVVSNAAGGIQ